MISVGWNCLFSPARESRARRRPLVRSDAREVTSALQQRAEKNAIVSLKKI